MKPSRLFAFTLGTLSAIGGFIDIGDLVANAQVGARFGLRLAWVTLLLVMGIMCFSEMADRVALTTKRPHSSWHARAWAAVWAVQYFAGYTEVAAIAAARPAGMSVRNWHMSMLAHGAPSPRHLRTLLGV